MPFNFTNPVNVGDYVLKSQYDVTWDNVDFLHDDVLQLDAAAGAVVLGYTNRVNIKSIGRTTQAEYVDILGGTNTAEDARVIIYGAGAASGASVLFVQELGTDPFIFATPNNAAALLRIDGSSTQGIIDRAADSGSILIRGGPNADDASITMYGENGGGTASMEFDARVGNHRFLFRDAAAASVFDIDPSTGNSHFYNPADGTDYVLIEADGTPAIGLYQNSAVVSLWTQSSIGGTEAGQTFSVVSDAIVNIQTDADASGTGPHNFVFSSAGLFVPVSFATASAPAGTTGGIYYDTTLSKLRVWNGAAYETITSV